MPKLKYLWAKKLSSQQKAIWAKNCPKVRFYGDDSPIKHIIASPSVWQEVKISEIQSKIISFGEKLQFKLKCNQSEDPESNRQPQMSEQSMHSPIEELPSEVILKIFRNLSIKDFGRCAQVSKIFQTNAYDPSLWKKISIIEGKKIT